MDGFQPNSEALASLLEMGFELEIATAALKHGNNNLMSAIEWIEKSGEDSDEYETEDDEEYEDIKMVLVVRKDLGMGKGKIAAQCCHAALGAYRRACAAPTTSQTANWLKIWETVGEKKVVLEVDSEKQLQEIYAQARAAQLPSFSVHDAGRTQIAAGSNTVVSIGPAVAKEIDKITGKLKLMN